MYDWFNPTNHCTSEIMCQIYHQCLSQHETKKCSTTTTKTTNRRMSSNMTTKSSCRQWQQTSLSLKRRCHPLKKPSSSSSLQSSTSKSLPTLNTFNVHLVLHLILVSLSYGKLFLLFSYIYLHSFVVYLFVCLLRFYQQT